MIPDLGSVWDCRGTKGGCHTGWCCLQNWGKYTEKLYRVSQRPNIVMSLIFALKWQKYTLNLNSKTDRLCCVPQYLLQGFVFICFQQIYRFTPEAVHADTCSLSVIKLFPTLDNSCWTATNVSYRCSEHLYVLDGVIKIELSISSTHVHLWSYSPLGCANTAACLIMLKIASCLTDLSDFKIYLKRYLI